MEPVTIHLGEHKIPLVYPRKMSTRYCVSDVSAHNLRAACAAALGLCLPPGLHRCKTTPDHHRGNFLAYGLAVFDELLDRGYSEPMISAAGIFAFNMCCNGLFSEAEVKAAEVFTEGPEGSTTP